MISVHTRAVFFDAVGTVLHPVPGAPAVYAAAAARFGLPADPATILARFKTAYLQEEQTDAAAGWATSEDRERRRWQAIVAATLPGAPDECFDLLYRHFAKPEAWQAPARAAEVFDALHARGLRLGLASNYDSRLATVLAGRPELARLREHVIVSSMVGVRKPGAGFFVEVLRAAECRPEDVVFVGDDVENDYAGATAAGMTAILLDPSNRHPNVPPRIRDLGELLAEARS